MRFNLLSKYHDLSILERKKTGYLLVLVILLFLIIVIGTVTGHFQLPPSAARDFLFVGDVFGITVLVILVPLILRGYGRIAGWIFMFLVPAIFFFHMVLGHAVTTETLDYNAVTQTVTAGIAFYFFLTLFAFSAVQVLAGVSAMITLVAAHTYVIYRFHYNSSISSEVFSQFTNHFILLVSAGIIAFLATRMNQQALTTVISNNINLEKKVGQRTEELRQAKDYAEQLARTDMLSGLRNRRSLFEIADREILRCLRYKRELSVIMIDIDHFKRINDTHGHQTGDEAIQYISNKINTLTRETDTCGRIGGEEFVILLPETDLQSAAVIAERFRSTIESSLCKTRDLELKMTISLGVSQLNGEIKDFGSLLDKADNALYKAKNSGRNQVVLYEQQ